MKDSEIITKLTMALRKFAQHDSGCHWIHFTDQPCDCGLHYAERLAGPKGEVKSDE